MYIYIYAYNEGKLVSFLQKPIKKGKQKYILEKHFST